MTTQCMLQDLVVLVSTPCNTLFLLDLLRSHSCIREVRHEFEGCVRIHAFSACMHDDPMEIEENGWTLKQVVPVGFLMAHNSR